MIFRRGNGFPLFPSLRLFSSSSSTATTTSQYSSFFSHNRDGQSPVYRKSPQFMAPKTIISTQILLKNSVSLIGTIVAPVKRFAPQNGDFCVWTFLEPKRPSSSSVYPFRIGLKMWDEVAEISLKHLRPKDFVYVSGPLGTYYDKVDGSGKFELCHKVTVKELSYVACNKQDRTCLNPNVLDLKEETVPFSDVLDFGKEERDRLHLWQVFFANPHEWWDNRQKKVHPSSPDFRHKDSDERLSLSPNDPPWVRAQLELLDLKKEEQRKRGHRSASSRVSLWEYDE